jgi:hypothetical protein
MDIRAVVVGGSLGGLSSALALRYVNCNVDRKLIAITGIVSLLPYITIQIVAC